MTQQQVVDVLIQIGQRAVGNGFGVDELLERIRQYGDINRQTPEFWTSICTSCSDDDVAALVCGLALAETKLPFWSAGSVAGVIWTFRELEQRKYPRIVAVAEWAVANTRNSYAPFGSMVHRDERLGALRESSQESRFALENAEIERELRSRVSCLDFERSRNTWLRSMLVPARLASEVRLLKSELASLEAATSRQMALMSKDLADVRHMSYKAAHDHAHAELLANGEALAPAERLRMIARRADVPIGMIPKVWAIVPPAELQSLSLEDQELLRARLAKIRKGPWRALREMIPSRPR